MSSHVPFLARWIGATTGALLPLIVSTSEGASPFRVGEPVPQLLLPSIGEGGARDLSDFRGQRLLLHVWASW